MKKKFPVLFIKMFRHPVYRIIVILSGILSMPIILVKYLKDKKNDAYENLRNEISRELEREGIYDQIKHAAAKQIEKKNEFFSYDIKQAEFDKAVDELLKKQFNERILQELETRVTGDNAKTITFSGTYGELVNEGWFLPLSLIISFPMYMVMLIYSDPYMKFISERLFMMIFVIFGVTWLVFTILYMSPMNPAVNILGQTATPEQVQNFNSIYGLDKSYLAQLVDTFKGLFTFDLGRSYVGNEDVFTAIMRKFPVTLQVTFFSLILAVLIAIPAGVISAIKQYSTYDYGFMLLALLGLSIPNFWLGLILILNFSIKLNWLPATFIVGNWMTFIMPTIVLGTGLAASVARMTRSSMLEVKNMDYVFTARAKGLSENKVITRHILKNAMIPIITVIGLQFGGMLGGSAVTEKVFNINGIGSFIVDKQFVPDIPIVLAGVVYVAIVISLANLVVDLIYAFLDPRIKSKMKSY